MIFLNLAPAIDKNQKSSYDKCTRLRNLIFIQKIFKKGVSPWERFIPVFQNEQTMRRKEGSCNFLTDLSIIYFMF